MTGPPAAPAPAGAASAPTHPLKINPRRIASLLDPGLVRAYTRSVGREVPRAPAANTTPGVPRAVRTRPLAVADAAALRPRRGRHRDPLRRDRRVGGAARDRLRGGRHPPAPRPPPPPPP